MIKLNQTFIKKVPSKGSAIINHFLLHFGVRNIKPTIVLHTGHFIILELLAFKNWWQHLYKKTTYKNKLQWEHSACATSFKKASWFNCLIHENNDG
jgi:hypothetical protein